MKKVLLLFAIVLSLLLSGCAAQVAGLQQLPEEGVNLVFILVTAGVTWLLLQLFSVTGWDLRGYSGAIAAALSPALVTWLESYLQLIDPAFDNLVLTVIHFLVLLVGSLGTFWLFQRKPAPSVK